MFDLKRVPYDIRPYIFEHLDQETLLNACLASRSLNELASWPLYSYIVINGPLRAGVANKKQPYAALRRRPVLRNAVTEVKIYRTLQWQRVEQWKKDDGLSLWTRCGEELKKMPHLMTLRICGYSGSEANRQYEEDLLFSMISTTPNIRRLHIPHNIPYIYTDKLKGVHDIIVNGYSFVLEEARSSPLNSRVRELHVPGLVWSDIAIFAPKLQYFSALVSLELGGNEAPLPHSIFEALRGMHDLRELSIACAFPADSSYEAIGLRKLKILKVTMRWTKNENPVKLGELVECLAAESSLRHLTIKDIRDIQVEYSGDEWLLRIIRRHAKTLVELRMLQFHPSPQSIYTIFGQCPVLEVLSIGVNQQIRALLPNMLPRAKTLRVLRLLLQQNMRPWTFVDSSVFLLQSSTSLQELKVYVSGRERIRVYKATWKTEWHYDPILKCATRLIQGPDQVRVPPQRREGDITAHDEDYEYLYQDPNDYDRYSD